MRTFSAGKALATWGHPGIYLMELKWDNLLKESNLMLRKEKESSQCEQAFST